MNIGEVIVNLRKETKLKQKDLAKSLDISATYLSLIENNQAKPSVTLLAQIADFFNLPVTAILFQAIDNDELTSSDQKKYFKTAKPIVDALIEYLLPENTPKGKDPSVKLTRGEKESIFSKAV